MTLRLDDSWVWDSWYVRDALLHHAYLLSAPRSLPSPEDRHLNVTIAHATSTDLVNWTVREPALSPSRQPAFDDAATWTGSVLRHGELWWMFYTGAATATDALVQTIGLATSPDLFSWTRHSDQPIVELDQRWYEVLDRDAWHDQAWRDPWVFRHHDQFHMLVTARARKGPARGRGVIGHCTSPDLLTWTAQPPLTRPGVGFGHLEVPQVEVVDNVPVLIFSCGTDELDPAGRHDRGGVFSVVGDSVLGPFDMSAAGRFPHDSLYAARLVLHDSQWFLIGFRDRENGSFVGELTDPIAVTATTEGGLIPR